MRQMLSRILVSLGLLVGCSGVASATIVYTIDTPNPALGVDPGPYAQVSINLTSGTTADIVFTSLANGGFYYLMGSAQAADLNVNGAFSIGLITALNSIAGFSAPSCNQGAAGNADGFGKFSLTIDCFDGFTHAADSISFTLTKTSGTWISDADVLVANKNNAVAAVHSFACPITGGNINTCDAATTNVILTGFAATGGGGGPPVNIPEPQTLGLLGLGLVVLAAMRRKRVN